MQTIVKKQLPAINPNIYNAIKKSFGTFNPQSEKTQEAEKWFNDIENKVKIEQTKSNHIPLFQYINSQKGMNSSQYQTFWTNYLYRTAYTVAGVLNLVKMAHLSGDIDATQYGANNLGDELAIGKKSEPHPKLLEKSGNQFGETIFGAKDTTIANAKKSSYLLPESLTDRRVRESLYNSNNPIEVFGTNYIHEALAGSMLDTIYKTVYKPYQTTYDDIKGNGLFKKEISPYFDVHLEDEVHGNVEDEHMRIARDLVFRYLTMSDNIGLTAKELESSIVAFSRSQNCLWEAIQKDMEARSKEGAIIPKGFVFEASRIIKPQLNVGKLVGAKTGGVLQDSMEKKQIDNASPTSQQVGVTKDSRQNQDIGSTWH